MTLDELVTEARCARRTLREGPAPHDGGAGWDEERARRVFVMLTERARRQSRRAVRARLVRRSLVAVSLMVVLLRGAIGAAGAAAGPSPAAADVYASNTSDARDAGYARD